jgi:hypothetical protein
MVIKMDILLNGMFHLLGGMEGMKIETLRLKMAEEVLHTCIIPTVPFSGHTGLNIISFKQVAIVGERYIEILGCYAGEHLGYPVVFLLFSRYQTPVSNRFFG